jgi:hypothetical protein
MVSNMPPGYSDEGGDIAASGEETALYEELRSIFDKYRFWFLKYQADFFNTEDQLAAAKICNEIEALLCQMEGPF